MSTNDKLKKLRLVITENLRVQRGGADPVPYIDVANVLNDIGSRQNHAVFARRGCGKSLLLNSSRLKLESSVKSVYLNCEDFKRHTFPNVLLEILDALFAELEQSVTRWYTMWFGKKRKARILIAGIRKELAQLRSKADMREEKVRELHSHENSASADVNASVSAAPVSLRAGAGVAEKVKAETERTYQILDDKIKELDTKLPSLKAKIREFFDLTTEIKGVYLQLDDFYHLNRVDQPLVMDYIHRLCKDLPLYFKVATLKHASTLFADRDGQLIGAQERHDYQPINIDFTFADFRRTRDQNRKIFHEFAKLAGMSTDEFDELFKGEGLERLILAGGGVPRDCLSMFLEVLGTAQAAGADGRIGKDDVRILSRSNFERRIEELKQDCEGNEQDTLIRGIYVLRKFCIDRQTNVFLVSEQMMQQEDQIRGLIYRLLDYRIIHSAGSALTHKSQPGTFQAFAIDIGCYAHMRKLHGRFAELNLADSATKEAMRSAPVLNVELFDQLWKQAPQNAQDVMLQDDGES